MHCPQALIDDGDLLLGCHGQMGVLTAGDEVIWGFARDMLICGEDILFSLLSLVLLSLTLLLLVGARTPFS